MDAAYHDSRFTAEISKRMQVLFFNIQFITGCQVKSSAIETPVIKYHFD